MFNNGESEMSNIAKLGLIIVYDENSRLFAIDICNDIAHKYSCCVWNGEQFRENEPKLTNRNKILFLDSSLKKEHLGRVDNKIFLDDKEKSYFKVRGNQIGIFGFFSMDEITEQEPQIQNELKILNTFSLGFFNKTRNKVLLEIIIEENQAYIKTINDNFINKYLDDFMNGKLH